MTTDEPAEIPAVELEPVEERDYEGPLLAAHEVVAGYVTGVDILRGCELELYKGELVGIIGPNGAGKSTLLKAMFGLVPIRSGSVVLRDQDITEAKAHLLVSLGVGYVPQNNNVFPSLSVQENLEMGMYQRPRDLVMPSLMSSSVVADGPPRQTSTSGSTNSICFRTNGRQICDSCGVGVRLPGGRHGMMLAM